MLCLSEDVDEFVMQILAEHEGKKLMSINSDKAELLSEEEKKEAEKAGQDNKQLLEFVKESLGGEVKDVRISTKLKSHAVFLSTEGEMSIEMEKYLNAVQPDAGIKADKVLELNAEHEAFNAMKKAFDSDKEKAAKYAKILYCQALLIAGIPLENPSEYSDMVCGLMS